jgi:hypothetical protein
LFITVNAGASAALFHMESLAAIVPPQPKEIPTKTQTGLHDLHFGMPIPAAQSAPEMLFAFPEGSPLNQPLAEENGATDTPQNPSSTDLVDVTPLSSDPVSEIPHVEAETPHPPIVPPAKPSTSPEPGSTGQTALPPAQFPAGDSSSLLGTLSTRPSSKSQAMSRLLEDKRSCRFAENEDGTFYTMTK